MWNLHLPISELARSGYGVPEVGFESGSLRSDMANLTPRSYSICLDFSGPIPVLKGSQKSVTAKVAFAPTKALMRLSSSSRSAATISISRSTGLLGLFTIRISCDALNSIVGIADKASMTPKLCRPVAPVTTISLDILSIGSRRLWW